MRLEEAQVVCSGRLPDGVVVGLVPGLDDVGHTVPSAVTPTIMGDSAQKAIMTGPPGAFASLLHGAGGWRPEVAGVGGRPLSVTQDLHRAVQGQCPSPSSHPKAAA